MPDLLRELCRVFNATEIAMRCALSHGQVSIDGYIIRPQHLDRWSEDQLRGRYVVLSSYAGQRMAARRVVQLYGSTLVRR